MKKIVNEKLDEYLVLLILEKQNADVYNVRERVLQLSGGAVFWDIQYLGIVFFRLRSAKLIESISSNPQVLEHRITPKGRNELIRLTEFYCVYGQMINKVVDSMPQPESKEKFEELFGSFKNGSEYNHTISVMSDLVRSAFATGWAAAGGTPAENEPIAELIKKQK